jgi:YARHG domain
VDIPSEPIQRFCPQCSGEIDSDARFCKHCAFDLATPQITQETGPTFELDQPIKRGYMPLVVGGIVLSLMIGAVGFFAFFELNGSRETSNLNSNSSSPPTLGAKAQKAEEKILRGESLTPSDIDGLTPEELRIVRNVHFARYGRKYDRPGLGDYFSTKPWYKVSDTYNDNMVTGTDKSNIDLILAAEKNSVTATPPPMSTSDNVGSSGTLASTDSAPKSTSGGGSLNNSNVQNAVDSFMRGFTKGGSIIVEGIRELPNENAATADLRFSDWVSSTTYEGRLSKENPPPVTKDPYGMPSSTFGLRLKTYNVRGIAILKHYTDGRWVMSEVRLGSGLNTVTLSGSQEVR